MKHIPYIVVFATGDERQTFYLCLPNMSARMSVQPPYSNTGVKTSLLRWSRNATREIKNMYTVTAPKQSWLGKSSVETLGEAVHRRAAWKENQHAHAIILNPDGYIVSTYEQNMFLAGYTR